MNILVLAAHPDDETLGCGGTIKKLSANNDVRVITFTDGGSAREEENDRRHQLTQASNLLKFTVAAAMSYPDNALDSVPLLELNRSVESYLEKIDFVPDMIITHNPWCLNADHRKVFECAQVVSRLYPCKFLVFEVPSSSEWNLTSSFRANCHVSLSQQHVDAKLAALNSCYGSEMRKYPHPRSLENIVNQMRVNGAVVGVEYAERFMSLKEVL